MNRILFISAVGAIFISSVAWAGDAATVIFKSGQVVQIEDGFRQVVEGMKSLNGVAKSHQIVELNIGGGTFLLNIAEVVVVCRDKCAGLTVMHQLDPKRGGYRTNIDIQQQERSVP